MFTPERVNVLAPSFTNDPFTPEITPEKVVEALLVTVKVEAPKVTAPAPERFEIVATLVPDVSKAAPLATVTLALDSIVPLPSRAKIPEETVVVPV